MSGGRRALLRPLSLYASGDSSGRVSLEKLCNGDMRPQMTGAVELGTLVDLILRGGWPGSRDLPPERAARLPEEYLNVVLDQARRHNDGVRPDPSELRLVLRSLARNESRAVDGEALMRDIKAAEGVEVDLDTVRACLDLFRRLSLTDDQPPFLAPIISYARVKGEVKRHFSDPSLACALLGATHESLMRDPETLERLFEALCARDLRIYAESFGAALYHYRDDGNRRFDAVIERPDGRWCGFAIVLCEKRVNDAAVNLKGIRREIVRDPRVIWPDALCVLCGVLDAAYRRLDGVLVVPITALRE